MQGAKDKDTIRSGVNLIATLMILKLYSEVSRFGGSLLPTANEVLGADHVTTLHLRQNICAACMFDPASSHHDVLECESIVKDVLRRKRRIFGAAHPETRSSECALAKVRQRLAGGDVGLPVSESPGLCFSADLPT